MKKMLKLTRHVHDEPINFNVPDGFVMLMDNREQHPLYCSERGQRDGLPYTTVGMDDELVVVDCTLHDGDYSIKGFEDLFAIERKGLSDLHGYIGRERTLKTTPKMEKFRDMVQRGGYVALVIEASEQGAWLGPVQSQMTQNQIRAALVSFEIRYGVRVHYEPNRERMARWVLDRAIKFYNVQKEAMTCR